MRADKTQIKCVACGCTMSDAEAGAVSVDCPMTNSYEHDFPGWHRAVLVAPAACSACKGSGIADGKICGCAHAFPAP